MLGACLQVKSIYVGNLPDIVDEHKLKDLFLAYGQVSFCFEHA